jgi:hypothetical protein
MSQLENKELGVMEVVLSFPDPNVSARYNRKGTLVSINIRPTPSGGKFCDAAAIILNDVYHCSGISYHCSAIPVVWKKRRVCSKRSQDSPPGSLVSDADRLSGV